MLNSRQGLMAIKSGTNEKRTGTFASKVSKEVEGAFIHLL